MTTTQAETILLVEDDEQVRTLVQRILARHGYQVLEANNVTDAVRIAGSHIGQIALLLTDVIMPEMSGWMLAERLNSLRPSMKVLYMSGYTGDAMARHGALPETLAFIQKPITPESLLRKVIDVLQNPKLGALKQD